MKTIGRKYLGRDYDLRFEWSDDKIYCSELVWKIYKEAFNIALLFIVATGLLSLFGLSKYRPGLAGLIVALGSTIFVILRSLALLAVIPLYRQGYLDLDFAEVDFAPSTFVFDAALWLHYLLIVVFVLLAFVAIASFVQRLREGNPLIRKLI